MQSTVKKIDPADAALIADPLAYGEWHELQKTFARLRKGMPVGLAEVEGFRPFWVVTRHADIMAMSKDNATFLNAPKSVVFGPLMADMLVHHITEGSPHLVRSMVTLDAPDHMFYRKLTQSWFMPKNLANIEAQIREIAVAAVDRMVATGGACDFATEVSVGYPLHVIMQLLGVPEEDEPLMLRLTQEMFGGEDPEKNRMRSG